MIDGRASIRSFGRQPMGANLTQGLLRKLTSIRSGAYGDFFLLLEMPLIDFRFAFSFGFGYA